jgi:pimeloyl-ACP methyl ester carboxylesterase
MTRFILRGLLGLAILTVVVVVALLAYRVWRQHENAVALAIRSPNGIDERLFVPINGIDQWVTIRGEDRRNPVLLILAGGPGDDLAPLTSVFKPWERYFTVVQWDQRGSGRTFEQNGEGGEGAMTVDQFTADGIKLTEFLRSRLRKNKIVILGDSFGTEIGVRMAKARPDYYWAYVGTGQVVSSEAQEAFNYAALLKKVRAAHDANSIGALERIGAPPYRSLVELSVERDVAHLYDTEAERNLRSALTPIVLFDPDTTILDLYYSLRFGGFAGRAMVNEVLRYDARKLGPNFGIPMFVIEGDEDSVTPTLLSRPWFAGIRAPKKEFVILTGGGHSAMLTMPDVFLKEIVERVRPVAVQN